MRTKHLFLSSNLFFPLLCFIFAGSMLFWHACDKSATYDEVDHIQCGYYHWHHLDFDRGLEHPPLIRLIAALPLNFLNLQDPEILNPSFLNKPLSISQGTLYGTFLLYRNLHVSADTILILSRAMIIIITLFLFGIVYYWSKQMYGPIGGNLSLFLIVTTPAFLAHGSLVTTDIGGVAGAVFALYAFHRFLIDTNSKNLLFAGLALGVAQVSKLSNIILFPAFAFLLLVYPTIKEYSFRRKLLFLFGIFFISGFIINCCYGFQNFLPPHAIHPRDLEAYQWPAWVQWIYRWVPLPDFYLNNLGFVTYHVKQGFSTFFLGKIYPEGIWYFFPIAFVLRTPLITLLILLSAFVCYLYRRTLKKGEIILILTLLVYTATAMRSKLNLGIRHFLFVYPLLFILAGRLTEYYEKLKKYKTILTFVFLFQLTEIFWIAPNFMGYFNILVGGAPSGIHYMSDSDYGQELKSLGKFLKNYPGHEIVLSYFGTALPEAYDIFPQELMPTGTLIHSKKVNSDRPVREFLAVSACHLQGHMVGIETFKWLRNRVPFKNFGYSIFLFDITNDLESHQQLSKIYEMLGDSVKSQRHLRRVTILKNSPPL